MLYLHSFAKSRKKKVLFIHGLLGSTKDFLPIIQALKDRLDCYSIDLPGHGKSPWSVSLSKSQLLEEISSLIEYHNISFIVGYSLGGRLAMEIESMRPNLLEKLVIISAHPGIEADETQIRSERIAEQKHLLNQSPLAFLNYWYSQPLFITLSKKKMLKKRKNINVNAVSWMLNELSLLKQPSFWEHLYKSPSKYFFICGESDRYYKKLYSAFSQKKTILGCSHAAHLEKPQQCYQIILKHLI